MLLLEFGFPIWRFVCYLYPFSLNIYYRCYRCKLNHYNFFTRLCKIFTLCYKMCGVNFMFSLLCLYLCWSLWNIPLENEWFRYCSELYLSCSQSSFFTSNWMEMCSYVFHHILLFDSWFLPYLFHNLFSHLEY